MELLGDFIQNKTRGTEQVGNEESQLQIKDEC